MEIEGDMIDFQPPHDLIDPISADYVYTPNFDFWVAFIARLSAAGFTAKQLEWPGTTAAEVSCWRSLVPGGERYGYGREKFLLNKFVLTPLLAARDMLDPRNPLMDVRKQWFLSWREGIWPVAYWRRDGLFEGQVMVEYAVDMARGDPGEWCREWCDSR